MSTEESYVDTPLAIAMAAGLEDAAEACSAEQAVLKTRLMNCAKMMRDCVQQIRELRHALATLRSMQ